MTFNLNNVAIDDLVSDSNEFNKFVYTPLAEAVPELCNRWKDRKLEERNNKYFANDIPDPLNSNFKAVLFRQLFTSNYEFKYFMSITKTIGIEPMFLEYYDDKFTTNNPLKHALGKLKFQQSIEPKDEKRRRTYNVIHFNESAGRKIKEVRTIWNQSLIDFHHELLEFSFRNTSKYLFDASDWFHRGGKNAKEYYSRYISLFLRNGILFENFLLGGCELIFVKEIFLPAFIDVWKKNGVKPIIVALLPLDSQENIFWMSHPLETLNYIRAQKIIS